MWSIAIISSFYEGEELTDLKYHIFVSVPSQDMDFQRHMVWHFFAFNDLRWKIIVRFVDIGGIVDHHYSNIIIIYNGHTQNP
jgi:hypothetical protein